MHCLALTSVVVVGLERTFYQVSEDVGVVEVCAVAYSRNMTCHINNITLLTTDRSAGTLLVHAMMLILFMQKQIAIEKLLRYFCMFISKYIYNICILHAL